MQRGRTEWLVALLVSILLSACAGPSWQHLPPKARAGRIQTHFQQRYVWRLTPRLGSETPLIVVLDGDGHPWIYHTLIARDPTPSDPLLWTWFRQWSGQALYLGRPCYFPQAPGRADKSCSPYWYTNGRYSPAVVESLRLAIKRLALGRPVVLLGHSGGGTLAMLLAPRLAHACAVVTIAGNLNVGAWVRSHHYTPLQGSLDPALEPPLPAHIAQWHLYSIKDRVIHARWVIKEARRQKAHMLQEPASGHDRDWPAIWPRLDGLLRERILPSCSIEGEQSRKAFVESAPGLKNRIKSGHNR